MKRWTTALTTIVLLAALAIMAVLRTSFSEPPAPLPQVVIAGQTFSVEIADTPQKRERGLSGRDRLAENEGMLFLFPQPAQQNFWMRDMKFPIDIIWLRGPWVIGFVENAQPSAGNLIPTFTSPPDTDLVLEVAAGTARRLNMKTGDMVTLSDLEYTQQ